VKAVGILCASVLLLVAVQAEARSVGELASGVRQARETSRRLAAGAWDVDGETALVDRIDRLSQEFLELAGTGASMSQTADALLTLMENVRERYTKVLEKMQADVIREDGDLEAVQDSAAWRQRELLAMRVLYRLNWVRYEIANRYESSTPARRRLLESARDGFAEFMAAGDKQIAIEARFGHGLTLKALREYDSALDDFHSALAQGPGADTAARIRAALAETQMTRGRIGDAISQTGLLLHEARGGEILAQARFLRCKALLLAVGKYKTQYSASARGSYRAEAAGLLEKLYNSGSYWRAKVIQLIDAGVDDPLEWAAGKSTPFVTFLIANSLRRRGECDSAIRLYGALLEREQFTSESHYGKGFCSFHEGRYDEAIAELNAFLEASKGEESFYGQAEYLRFKAAEALYLREGSEKNAAIAEAYFHYAKELVEKAPDYESAFEAWYRLGEWYRDHGDLVQAAKSFAKVQGDPAFHINASFQAAQSYFEAVVGSGRPEPADPETAKAALAAIDRFIGEAEEFRTKRTAGQGTDALINPLEAKAVIMGAAVASTPGVGTMKDRLSRLADFKQRFPDQRALLPEVASLRIVAFRTLGNLDAAGSELESLLAMPGGDAYHHDALKKLALVFLKEASSREERGDLAGATRSRKTALRVYERLLADSRDGMLDGEPIAGLERLVADLRAQVQPAGG